MQQNAYFVAVGVNAGLRVRRYDGRSPQLLVHGAPSERVCGQALLLMLFFDIVQDLLLVVAPNERLAREMLRVAFASVLGHQPQSLLGSRRVRYAYE